MIYKEGSYIIREGEPLDMMFFVTQGIVLTYATNNGESSCSSGTIQLIKKEKDSLYGEELLTLVEGPSSKLSTLPISTVTVKSHKKVEVFALKAVDLLKVFFEVPSHFNTGHMEIVSA
jgi:cyclic nucleotide gated channel